MKQLLKKLVETPGVSGSEAEIREVIREEVEEHVDSIEEDDFGNLIVKKGEGDKKLLLDAHMDQIGLSVRRIDEEGYLRVSAVGGIYPNGVNNQRMVVHTSKGDNLKGIVGIRPPHLDRGEDAGKSIQEMKKLFIDIGAEDKEDAEDMGVRVGDVITYDRDFSELGNDYVTAPAFDNRVGCLIAIEALKQFDEDYELAVVFAAQEEVGTKGARTAAFRVDPDVAIAIDTGMAGDVPGVEPDEVDADTGNGVGIDMIQAKGRGLITPESIKSWLVDTAEQNNHNYFRSLYDGGATDAASINLVREGIPTGSIGPAARNIHSPVEVVKISDIEDTVEFLSDAFSTMENHF